ncbi:MULTISPECIES: hypothetical protein [unclassified Pseudactinotalea]|uniref:hypothetical protein n=1 Tax=unclassified Pseudactinotalea TaxID=2649176 RepID=UPI00128BAF78|nr:MULTISPECIES: hypothetical protein [unclassified Pseudactinotalea]MPV51367.1 hypothetical protein [Pseudactinotalea sp. HY160]QGH70792.1 hypothetical protein GCE65_15785 [Pseudactinotalea sp. HY158]
MIHQRAVAQVVAEYLWETGQVDDAVTDLPRRLRDRISRALAGTSLSTETLRWFIEAFDMNQIHADSLWNRYRNDAARAPSGVGIYAPPGNNGEPRRPVSRADYRVRTLDEFHQLGPDGLPNVHQTYVVIEALARLERYTFQFDTDHASVEVLRGGTRGASYPNPDRPEIWAVDIEFADALTPGETAALEYRTFFHYPGAPEPVFRRIILDAIPAVTMEVRFNEARLPARVWWSTWESIDSHAIDESVTPVDRGGTAHRFLENTPPGIFGFRWAWE